MARPSGSVPFLAARLSGQWPLAMADSSKLFPASQTTLPERESKMVQPRVPDAVVGGVDAVDAGGAGAERGDDAARGDADDRDVVVLLQGDGDAASVGGDLHVLGLRIALHRFPPENSPTATCGLGPPHLGGAGVMGGGDRVNRS